MVLACGILVWAPGRLIAEVSEAPPPSAARRLAAVAMLAAVPAVLLVMLPISGAAERLALAVAAATAIAIAFVDVRWLVIPDLYSLVLAGFGLAGPLRQPLAVALLGAACAGGLVWGVRLLWKRMRGVEGLGFGDVKLAGALGCLLGPEDALRTVAVASILGALAGLVMRRRRPVDAPQGDELIPFGAPLALCGAGLLFWSRLR